MFERNMPPFRTGNSHLNLEQYRQKVRGCWMGKNIGGTFGAPYEGNPNMNDAKFYTNIVPGSPAPNDDLDIQLVWLLAAAENGLENLTPLKMGEYWFSHVTGPWNEYGVCRANISRGFMPPLSGSCNNETWFRSNGAWIRSEIWACLCPGAPDEAIKYAYMDACCDHYDDGIYAELFTAALESAAFVCNDLRELIRIAFSKIPAKSRVRRSVELAMKLYDSKISLQEAREEIVRDSADLGMFQAPANIAFVVLGLLYGEGDFEKSLQYAVNCGDDTDCTGATVGAIFGIMNGFDAIPEKWREPIGDGIVTVCINTIGALLPLPRTTEELTRQVVNLAVDTAKNNPLRFLQLTDEPTELAQEYHLDDSTEAENIWNYSPYKLQFPVAWGNIYVDYSGGPVVSAGCSKKIILTVDHTRFIQDTIEFQWHLPEGCRMEPGNRQKILSKRCNTSGCCVNIIFDSTDFEMIYIPVDIYLGNRTYPCTIQVPFQGAGTVDFQNWTYRNAEWQEKGSRLCRLYCEER